jgi:hypothetical protein
VLNPVPLTVELAERVVNAPAAAVVPPIAGGEAKYVLNPEPEIVPLAVIAPLTVMFVGLRVVA